jgi:hypothetical protein
VSQTVDHHDGVVVGVLEAGVVHKVSGIRWHADLVYGHGPFEDGSER